MKKYDQYILGSLKNGKLHGLVQIYGKLTADPEGHCSSRLFKGLSFVGWFEEEILSDHTGEHCLAEHIYMDLWMKVESLQVLTLLLSIKIWSLH